MSGALSNPLTFNGGYTADSGASFRFGFRQYSTATSSFTTPDQGGSGEKYTFASGNPAVLTDQLGLYSWSNFLQDVNHVSGWVSNGAGIVAMGCAATVVCAPAAPIAGGIAAVGAAVNVASGVAISGASCTDLKGSCSGAVATAAIVGIGSRFGAGKLVSRASDEFVDVWRVAGPDETADILRSGQYRLAPGLEGKYFYPTEGQATALASKYTKLGIGAPYTLTSGRVPRSALARGESLSPAGEGDAWFFRQPELGEICSVMCHGQVG